MEGMGRPHRFAVGDTDEVITDDSAHKAGAQHAAPLKSFQPFGASRLRGKKFSSSAAHHMSKRLLTAADRPRLQASRLGARCRSAQSHVFLFRCEHVLVPDESCAREGLLPQQRDRAAADPDERHIATVALANGHIDFSLNISPVLKHCALLLNTNATAFRGSWFRLQ